MVATADVKLERPAWLPREQWPFTPRGIEVEGGVVHVVDEGDGPTLLLVNAGQWSFIWRDVILRLRSRFRVVTLDFPGAGLSASDEPADLDRYEAALGAVADRLDLTDVTLVVHDAGATVGLGWAARNADRLVGLVVAQGYGWHPDATGLRVMLSLMGSRAITALGSATNVVMRLSSGRFGVGRHLDSNGRAAFRGPYRDRQTRRNFHRVLRQMRHADDRYARIEAGIAGPLAALPLLTIFGERNDPFGFQERWKQRFPAATQVVVPGGNHFPMCDDPDLFATSLTRWFETAVAASR